MKSIVFCLSLLLLTSACENDSKRIERLRSSKEHLINNTKGYKGHISRVYEFTYNGHDLISFEGSHWKEGFSVIHSPECKKCKEIEKQ